MNDSAIHDISIQSIDGQTMPLSRFEGKVLLIVNVASQCGFTPQYTGLQHLHEKYAERGLVVMGVPSNDFGKQEPGTHEEIQDFCESRYNVTFPMFEKVTVKGQAQHPLYAWLTSRGDEVSWNFNKFLVSRQGKLIRHFESAVAPESEELVQAIEAALDS